MRTIKFRGKRIDNGEWVYGDLVHDAFDGYDKTIPVGIQKPKCYAVEVHPETVGFISPYTDKNGTKCYEGDRFGSCVLACTLQLEDDGWWLVFDNNALPKKRPTFNGWIGKAEITGNIHDKK